MFTTMQEEALRHDISLCVTAGAGTGKTHVLVNRYIRLIKEAGCRPSEILALTFTEKAAAEMKERVEAEIRKESGGEWEEIKEEMMWANISTFHSFCSKIIREYAVELGIDPAFKVLSNSENADLVGNCINSLFLGRSLSGNGRRSSVASETVNSAKERAVYDSITYCLLIYDVNGLTEILRKFHEKRRYAKEFFAKLDADPDAVIENWSGGFAVQKKAVNREFFDETPVYRAAVEDLIELSAEFTQGTDTGTEYLRNVRDILPEILTDDPDKFCKALLALFSVKGSARMGKKEVFGDSLAKLRESYSLLKSFYDSLPKDLLKIDAGKGSDEILRTIDILKHIGRVFNALEDMIESEKRSKGAADFTDMIDLTYLLFTSRSELIARDYAGRFRFIMIDEFQDTDPTQAEIIYRLIDISRPSCGNSAGESVIPCNALFVVGDPKQSIYLFRDADVAQFKDAGQKIREDFGGGTVSLDVNFRSTDAVLCFVNRLFSDIFAKCVNKWDFRYDPLSVSDKRKNDIGSVELILTPESGNSSEIPSALNEANAIASRIRSIVKDGDMRVYDKTRSAEEAADGAEAAAADGTADESRPAKYGDIAVLIERRTNLKYFEYALRKYSIPYRVYGASGLYAKQEIKDCISLFSFLRNLHDGIALYGILRSPWFGFSDAELFRVFGGGNPFHNLRDIGNSDDADSSSLAEKSRSAYALLKSWRTLARRIAPSKLFARMIRESGLFAVYAGIAGGDMMTANVGKLADIIREHESEGYYTLDKLVYDLCFAAKSDDEEGEADLQPEIIGDNTVSIMTVHASKGLEFPIVILPELTGEKGGNREVSLFVDGDIGVGIKIPPLIDETTENVSDAESNDFIPSPPLALQKYLYQQKSHAETKRLFYVACTRARDHLILCGKVPKEGSEKEISVADATRGDSACRTRMSYLQRYLRFKLLETADSSGTSGISDTCARNGNTNDTGGEADNRGTDTEKAGNVDADNGEDKVCTLSGGISSGLYDISNSSFKATVRVIRYEDLPEFDDEKSAEDKKLIDADKLKAFENSECGAGAAIDTGLAQSDSFTPFDRKFSVTEVNMYLRSPDKHREAYLMHKAANPAIKGLGRHNESVDKGIIIHEIFAGADPKHVFDRYLVKDAVEMEEYRKCYRNFIGNAFIAGAQTIACELEFTVNIGGYIFKGAIDRLMRKYGELMIIDYKTGSKTEESERNSKYAVQMAVYQTAVREMCGQNARTFIYYTQTDEFGEVVFDASEVCRTIAETCGRIIGEEADSRKWGNI
ncbi:MAG: UvrD-helicase domain-containing protein [Methanomicrobium sp.]|nr:UvrD-helicase domain-containing protein [Methanomicrobium sp.]